MCLFPLHGNIINRLSTKKILITAKRQASKQLFGKSHNAKILIMKITFVSLFDAYASLSH